MIKENFCGVCAVVPLLLTSGTGVTTISLTKEKYKTKRKWILILGSITFLLSLVIIWANRTCSSCLK